MSRLRLLLCQLGAHARPRTLLFGYDSVLMRCDLCGEHWEEDWTDWQGLYRGAPRG